MKKARDFLDAGAIGRGLPAEGIVETGLRPVSTDRRPVVRPHLAGYRLFDKRNAAFGLLIYAFIVLGTGCAAKSKAVYNADVVYQRKGFGGERLTGHSIFVLPVMNRRGMDTASQKILMNEVEWVTKSRKDITFFFNDTFANIYERRYGDGSWGALCQSLSEGDVMVLQTSDRFWRLFKNDYVLILRLNNGIRIKTFEGKQAQRIRMESELWSKDSAEVVLRVQVSGYSQDKSTDDRIFIRDAIRQIFKSFPVPTGPVDNDGEW